MDRLDRERVEEMPEFEIDSDVGDISEAAWQFYKYRVWSNMRGGKKPAAD